MWQETNKGLYRLFQFEDFEQAFAFMKEVAEAAEESDHHPRWANEYNKVAIWLRTHSADDAITGKDRDLASQIDEIADGYDLKDSQA